MSQTHTNGNKNSAPLGVAAAAAATALASDISESQDSEDIDVEVEKKSRPRKVFVVVGQIHEFESVSKAEKFLNASGSPSEYTVIRGNRIETNKKVSLR
jgi:xanthine dehydrogenase iron-sulfur cluster and FAD-binding subunit A